jgi:cytochrome c biogenesis protein ResB
MIKVNFDFGAAKRTKWYEYAVRFLLGGVITVVTGILAKVYGPAFGGLFLAFPAIFPASATLVEKHQRQKKERAGIQSVRGREAAGLDAAGAVLGSIGLAAFAGITWRLLPDQNAALVLGLAVASWVVVSVLLWWVRKSHWGHTPAKNAK